MKRRMLKKSEVIREGYVRGLRKAQRIINEMIENSQVDDSLEMKKEMSNALMYGNWTDVKRLIQQGADVNFKDAEENTPLNLATQAGQTEICEMLIERGADVNIKNHFGWSPLHHAAWYGYIEICELLLNSGADINATDNRGWTPLYCAKHKFRREVYKLLQQYGAEE